MALRTNGSSLTGGDLVRDRRQIARVRLSHRMALWTDGRSLNSRSQEGGGGESDSQSRAKSPNGPMDQRVKPEGRE